MRFYLLTPPYFNADQDKFYTYSFCREDHLRLQKCLLRNQHRLQFLITYDNSKEIRQLYNWANSIVDKEWNYTINRTDDQTKDKSKGNTKTNRYKGKEIFITNYQLVSIKTELPVNLELSFA